jgi:hypothetical protein
MLLRQYPANLLDTFERDALASSLGVLAPSYLMDKCVE